MDRLPATAPDSLAEVDGTSSVTGTLPTVTIERAALLGIVRGWSMRDSVAMTGHGSTTTGGGASCWIRKHRSNRFEMAALVHVNAR